MSNPYWFSRGLGIKSGGSSGFTFSRRNWLSRTDSLVISGRAFQRLGACEPECSLTMPLGLHIFGLWDSKDRPSC